MSSRPITGMQPLVNLFRMELEIQRAKAQNQWTYVLELYDQVILIKEQCHNKLGLAKSIAEKAFVLEQLGYSSQALENYHLAEKVANGTPNREFLDTISNRINAMQYFKSTTSHF